MFVVVWCLALWLVCVFSVMWSELLMTSAISCPMWSSVYECHTVECAFTSPVRTECGMFVMCCMQCCMSMSAVWNVSMCHSTFSLIKLCSDAIILKYLTKTVLLISRLLFELLSCIVRTERDLI